MLIFNAWLTVIGIIGGISLFTYRYLNRQSFHSLTKDLDRAGFKRAILANVLLLIWALKIALERSNIPLPWWVFTLGALGMLWGGAVSIMGLSRIILHQKINDTGPHFWITACLSSVVVIADIIRRNYYTSLEALILGYTPGDWTFVAAYVAYALNLMYFAWVVIRIFIRSLARHTDVVYIARRWICIGSYVVGVLICIEGLVNLGIAIIWYNPPLIKMLSWIFHYVLFPLYGTLFLLGFIIPDAVLAWLVLPLRTREQRMREEQTSLLRKLHQLMIKLVPQVHFPMDNNNPLIEHVSMLTEISDARRIIWSHKSHAHPLTPEEEAEYLIELLQKQQTFKQAGHNAPPPLKQTIYDHNLEVARYLSSMFQ